MRLGWLILSALLPAATAAHDIPADVTVVAFIKAEGNRLRVAVRAPLEAMRDIQFPTHGPGYLDFDRADRALQAAAKVWILDELRAWENGRPLTGKIVAVRASVPSDAAFNDFAWAIDHLQSPKLPNTVDLPWQQATIDVLIEYPIESAASRFAIEPSFARLGNRTQTVLRYITPDDVERIMHFAGNPGPVNVDPRWFQAAFTFVKLGFLHILSGIDHLLFLLCLLLPFRQLRSLVLIVTAFTIAHSVTLVASALGWAPNALWFPPLVETLIAASIVYMALENIIGAKVERRWAVAFGFGLIHGFGFSFALRDSLELAGAHIGMSLFSFNLGVEFGQIATLLLAVPVVHWLFSRVVPERLGIIIVSAFVAHTAWHWLTERLGELREYPFQPAFNLTSVIRMVMLALIAGGAGWLMYELYQRFRASPSAVAQRD